MKRVFILFIAVLSAWILVISGVALAQNNSDGVPAGVPQATTWYVDAASGDDNNDCLTPSTACATVGGAAGKAADGDDIVIAAGVYDEDLDLSKVLTMTGAGPESTILDGANSHRILQTSGIADLTIADLTFRNGLATTLNDRGGAIYNLGTVTLQNVTVLSNTADNGGGGIYNNGTLLVQNSHILSNTRSGLQNTSFGTITLTNSLVAGNSGGGLNNAGRVTIATSTFRDNEASSIGGGAIFNGGTIDLEGATLRHNHAASIGAGIYNSGGTITMTNSTVSANEAGNYTGIFNTSPTARVTILNSTIAYNEASTAGLGWGGLVNSNDAVLVIQNSVVAHNDDRNCNSSGNWTSAGHNLASDHYCDFTAPGDLQNTDPLLSPLADYGGATWTHALQPASPAIDSGDNGACPATDQRGVPRPEDGDNDGTATCDMGAYEARNQLAVSDVTVTEGDAGTTNATFTVTLAPTSTQTVMVDYATMDGTATAGSDYVADSDTLTFSPGQATQVVTIAVNGDGDDEPDETFFLDLSNASNADVIDGRGVATIIDDDGLSSLTIADVTVEEGDSGTTNAAFVVTLSPAAAQTVSVDYATADGSATAGEDYLAAGDTLTFAPGETSQVIDVTVIGDNVDEEMAETFVVNLSNAVNANLVDAQAEGTITDDEIAQVSLQPGPVVVEGDVGLSPAGFTVTLSVPTAFPVTVDYATSSPTGDAFATPGVDYTPISGTLNFAPGEMVQTITVMVSGDTEAEEDETFNVILSNAAPIDIYGSVSIGHILDDDVAEAFIYLPLITNQ